MAIIESGLVEVTEAFLPYAVLNHTGQTLFQKFKESPQRLLLSGPADTGDVLQQN
jgi:hypothetical protein